jgi:hypothetical protein
MHTNPDILGGHISDKLVPRQISSLGIDQYSIEMVGMARPFIRFRWKSQWEVSKCFLVSCPYFLPPFPILLNTAELMDADSRLNVHHVVLVATLDDVVVLIPLITKSLPRVFAHPVEGKDLDPVSMTSSVVQDSPRRRMFFVVKAKAAETTECAGLFTFVGGFDGVSAVFYNHEARGCAIVRESPAQARPAKGPHDGFGMARYFGRHLLDISRGNVDQNGFSAGVNDGIAVAQKVRAVVTSSPGPIPAASMLGGAAVQSCGDRHGASLYRKLALQWKPSGRFRANRS